MIDQLAPVFASLRAHDVKYVTIGGIAAILHGVPRTTFDLDILIEATPENASRLLRAFHEAGMDTAGLITPDELLQHAIVVFEDRVRVDVQTTTPGLRFEDAWPRRQTLTHRDGQIIIVSRDDLIASKKAAGRPVDLDDVRMLEAIH